MFNVNIKLYRDLLHDNCNSGGRKNSVAFVEHSGLCRFANL